MSAVRKGMWGALLLGGFVLAFFGPATSAYVPDEEKLYDANAWEEDPKVWDGQDEHQHYLDEWDDQPYDHAWRSGELGTDENPVLVACWDGQTPGDEFEGNISRVIKEKNLSMRIVSLGRIPETSCGAFEAEPPDPTDAEAAYEAWARDASSTWAEVLSSPSLGAHKVVRNATVKTLTIVDCMQYRYDRDDVEDIGQLEPYCDWLHEREEGYRDDYDWDSRDFGDMPEGAGEGNEGEQNDEYET